MNRKHFFAVVITLTIGFIMNSTHVHAKNTDIQLVKAYSGHYLVPVTIKNHSTMFVVDTGATSSVLDTSLVQKVSGSALTKKSEVQGFTPSDEQTMTLYTVSELLVSGTLLKDITIAEQPIKAMFDGLYDKPIEGILGHDALSQLGLALDLKQDKLVPFNAKEHPSHTATPIKMSALGLPYISITLANTKVNLIIDSGATDIMLDKHKVKELKLATPSYPEGMVAMDEFGNQRQLGLIDKETVKINNTELIAPLLVDDFSQLLGQINADNQANISGVIGLHALAQFNAIVDIANNTLYLM